MKLTMPEIAANEALRKRLCDEIMSKKLSHAYIIEGAKGTGRHLLAKTIAEAMACENRSVDGLPLPCHQCESCRKIDNSICPDLIIVGRDEDKASIGIDAARFIRSDVRTVPNDLDIKVYIIEDADKMTVQAQNALLLTLEEPPSYVVFFLLCEQAGALLETVRSRAPIIRTEPISAELMADFICNSAPSSIAAEARQLKSASRFEFDEIIAASGGGIGNAYDLLEPKKRAPVLEARRQVFEFVTCMIKRSSYSEKIDVVSAFPKGREELAERLDTACLALRDLIVLKKNEDAPLCFFSDRNSAIELSDLRTLAVLLKILMACEDAADAVRRNANVRLTLTGLMTAN